MGSSGAGTVGSSVATAEIANGAVTKVKLAGAFLKAVVIAGGAAGDLTVTGAAVGDELVAVVQFDIAAAVTTDVVDLTSEFTLAANKINNTGGTATTGDKLLVIYLDLT